MVVTRSIMENRVDTIEQRMDSFEGTMAQIRELVLEQQARPQVTVEQIRQLIQERPARNRRRNGRGYEEEEDDEGSDWSTLSRESRSRHNRHGGGTGPRFFGSKQRLEIPLFKGEDPYGDEKNEVVMRRGAPWKDRGGSVKFKDPGDFNGARKDMEKGGPVTHDKLKGRKLNPAELEERSKKNLCFKYGDKWNREHVCKFKHRKLMLCEGSSEEEAEKEVMTDHKEVMTDHKVEKDDGEELKTLKLSLQSKEGFVFNKSFKMWCVIGERMGLALIDSGATSNFMVDGLVSELKLKLVYTPAYVIEVGNGDSVRNQGVCEGLKFQIQGVEFQQHFFLIELGGSEMVLGRDWLANLDNIEANFGELCLKWEVAGEKYNIQGDPSLCNRKGIGFYVQSLKGSRIKGPEVETSSEWDTLLTNFEDVFNMPAGLPPIREHDHAIVLKTGATIPNLRPYRYPFYQKNEIEKIVMKMLQARIDTIMVVVDRLTKYVHFLLVSHPYTAKYIAELFVKEVVRLHGFPSSIVSERDRVFLNSFWSELFKQARTKRKYSSAYHPQSDGQTEVVNRCVETYLRCLTGLKLKQWPRWLAWAEYWYNTKYHASLKSTPFEALYGRVHPTLIRGDAHPSAVEEVNKLTPERNEMIKEMQEQLLKARDQMKTDVNKHRREVKYDLGHMVYLKIAPYKLKKLAKRVNQKLSPMYYGPYEVIQKIGAVAYKLKLPKDSRVHPVFHASLLKKTIGLDTVSQPLLACMNEDWCLEPGPEEALDTRRNAQGKVEMLVKWKGLSEFENSWEAVGILKKEFPGFLLEVKESFEGGGIDSFDKVYSRENKGGGHRKWSRKWGHKESPAHPQDPN
ncbi:uncharacterized protein LOC131660807 [Vicia villosa]|uniref:uncharacterized protein LOC131660807 n=1 Tax=Vicia villosa TaxID=3911 RepID=UPI00273BF664|nr:uncharacterized protein LOC131660807 [Vicia villosa]XP_058786124.1 uncharacterized protein LOC131660807 [Vicia villosa]